MKFCPKCGNIMLPDKKRGLWVCRVCGYTEPIDGNKDQNEFKITEKGTSKFDDVIVVDNDFSYDVTETICPKCGKKVKAYYRILHMPKSDEEEKEVIIYKCANCGYMWKEEDD